MATPEPSQISDVMKAAIAVVAYFVSQVLFQLFTIWKTNQKTTEKAKELELNTPSPEDVRRVEMKVIALQKEMTDVKSDLDKYRGQAVNLALKYTEATNVLSKEFSAQRFALKKALEPGPNVDVSATDEPEQPLGKVIVKP